MTLKSSLRVLAVAILAVPLVASAQQAQQTPPAQQQAATPAPAKPAPAKHAVVWTDDNIGSVRSSADNYQMAQAQDKAAQQTAAKQGASSQVAADPSVPKTVQQADSMIAAKSHDLAGEQSYLKDLQKQVSDPTITGIEKERLEWRLKSHTVTEQTLQSQVKQLQSDRDALAKKPAPSNSSSSQPQL